MGATNGVPDRSAQVRLQGLRSLVQSDGPKEIPARGRRTPPVRLGCRFTRPRIMSQRDRLYHADGPFESMHKPDAGPSVCRVDAGRAGCAPDLRGAEAISATPERSTTIRKPGRLVEPELMIAAESPTSGGASSRCEAPAATKPTNRPCPALHFSGADALPIQRI